MSRWPQKGYFFKQLFIAATKDITTKPIFSKSEYYHYLEHFQFSKDIIVHPNAIGRTVFITTIISLLIIIVDGKYAQRHIRQLFTDPVTSTQYTFSLFKLKVFQKMAQESNIHLQSEFNAAVKELPFTAVANYQYYFPYRDQRPTHQKLYVVSLIEAKLDTCTLKTAQECFQMEYNRITTLDKNEKFPEIYQILKDYYYDNEAAIQKVLWEEVVDQSVINMRLLMIINIA